MEQKVIKVGNSLGVIIPKTFAAQMRLQRGSIVFIEPDQTSTSFLVTKEKKSQLSSITPEFLRIIEKVNQRYGSALRKLANM